jgi:hypothetical protein
MNSKDLDPYTGANKLRIYRIQIHNTACMIFFFYFSQGSRPQQEKLLFQTTSLYVGNMSFYTTEEQLYELFGKVMPFMCRVPYFLRS